MRIRTRDTNATDREDDDCGNNMNNTISTVRAHENDNDIEYIET